MPLTRLLDKAVYVTTERDNRSRAIEKFGRNVVLLKKRKCEAVMVGIT